MNSKEKHEKYFLEYQQHKKSACEDCRKSNIYGDDGYLIKREKLTIHHIDENVENNAPENLVTLCRKCHNKRHNIESKPKLQKPLQVWKEGKLYNIFTFE